ncbi:MAG: glycosyltransferase family 1 protein, partial [Bacteroidales bacterium]
IVHPQARHPVLWYLFFEWGIPPVLKRYKADLFLSPDGWLSLSSNVPSVTVIHDLNFFYNPEWVGWMPRHYYNHFFPKYIEKADRIATVSEFSRKDMASLFGVPESKIDVVYNGVNETFHPVDERKREKVKKEYTGGTSYFLFLGLVHPRKNLDNIILAYDLFRKSSVINVKLLVAGSTKYMTGKTRKIYKNSPYKDDIIFSGRIPEKYLNDVIGSSRALIYASLFEGFGIPILEAMRCNIPVITSNITSMPEIGGDAVCYVDPYKPESIASAMHRIVSDKQYCQDLIEKGESQYLKFSWDRTSLRLWNTMEKVLKL